MASANPATIPRRRPVATSLTPLTTPEVPIDTIEVAGADPDAEGGAHVVAGAGTEERSAAVWPRYPAGPSTVGRATSAPNARFNRSDR